MRMFLCVAALVSVTVLTGCDKLTEISISEETINSTIADKIHLTKRIGVDGVADADFTLEKLLVEIGREEPGKVKLNGIGSLKLVSLFGSRDFTISMTLRAAPYFDATSGSIYMRDIEITNYSLNPDKWDTLISALIPYLNSTLSTFFDITPVYVLSSENTAEAAARKFAKGIEIKPGRIVIPLTE
ncbi:lipoprotein [Morganella psychrotolerans]|uniref:lipoprotein n=1 Tax=Morganella psychrotolerans TaxID=368603 RepID=UPI0039B0B35A